MSSPNEGSGSEKLAIGGSRPAASPRITIASSRPTPIGWPVYPFPLVIKILEAPSPKTVRREDTSAEAEPPLGGV